MGIFQIDFLTLWLMSLSLMAAAAPTPDKNGMCASYIIQGYDTCGLIAKAHGITEADIESFNKQTWSWLGCNQLYQGDFICLSAGKPPMPMALPQATCGPQVPGTMRPKNWADLTGLNPCPAPQCVSSAPQPHTKPVFIDPALTRNSVLGGADAALPDPRVNWVVVSLQPGPLLQSRQPQSLQRAKLPKPQPRKQPPQLRKRQRLLPARRPRSSSRTSRSRQLRPQAKRQARNPLRLQK